MLEINKPVIDAKDLALWFEQELKKVINHGEILVEYEPRINSIKIGIKFYYNDDICLYHKRLCASEIAPILHPNEYSKYTVIKGEELARTLVTTFVNGFKDALYSFFVDECNPILDCGNRRRGCIGDCEKCRYNE